MPPLLYTPSRCVRIEAREMLHRVTAVGLIELLGKCKLQEWNFFGNVQGRAKLYETENENVPRKEGCKCVFSKQ
jgi:hypothetical protein